MRSPEVCGCASSQLARLETVLCLPPPAFAQTDQGGLLNVEGGLPICSHGCRAEAEICRCFGACQSGSWHAAGSRMTCVDRPDDFAARRARLAALSDDELHPYFWELVQKIVAPLIEEARAHTTPSIERSVLLRMGFSSIEAKILHGRDRAVCSCVRFVRRHYC